MFKETVIIGLKMKKVSLVTSKKPALNTKVVLMKLNHFN